MTIDYNKIKKYKSEGDEDMSQFVQILIKNFKGMERWSEVINKYGVRISTGDRISGILVDIVEEGVIVRAQVVAEEFSKDVLIQNEDIEMYRVGYGEWVKREVKI